MEQVYTSYFGNLRRLPDNVVPIAICGKSPNWYRGLEFKILAPKYDFFKVWKETRDNDFYVQQFNEKVLKQLDKKEIVKRLFSLANGNSFALLCYEKPNDFCHRHLVANWLRDVIDIKEWL